MNIQIIPVIGCLLFAGCASFPPESKQNILNRAQPVPANLATQAADVLSRQTYFIWRSETGVVQIPPKADGGIAVISIHYAIAPGVEPKPYEVRGKLQGRLQNGAAFEYEIVSLGTADGSAVAGIGHPANGQIAGKGTALVYFAPAGRPNEAISNALEMPFEAP